MKQKPENGREAPDKRPALRGRQIAILAAVIAVIQAFLTISGRGIEGFILWILILFVAYWLLFTFLLWLWRTFRKRL